MKHIFIINEFAGKSSSAKEIEQALSAYGKQVSYLLHYTEQKGEATTFIRQYCTEHPDQPVRFYACGGDGTLNEVASGVVGFENASFTVYACGSGNDFVKYYGGKDRFLDIPALLQAKETPIDIIDMGDGRYAVNACHFGFDSAVAEMMGKIRHKKIIGGSRAYPVSVAKALLQNMKTYCTVTVDGEKINDGTLLLCTVANGQYVGGSYRCAPRSLNDDGYLEICLAKPLSRLTFISLMNVYKKGLHLDDPCFEKYIVYRRGKCVEIDAKDPDFPCSLDGEIIRGQHLKATVMKKTVRFAVPNEK